MLGSVRSGLSLRKRFRIDLILLQFLVKVLPGDTCYFRGVGDVSTCLRKDLFYVSLLECFPGLLAVKDGRNYVPGPSRGWHPA